MSDAVIKLKPVKKVKANIKFKIGPVLNIHVEDEQNNPLVEANVEIYENNKLFSSVSLNQNGKAQIKNVTIGSQYEILLVDYGVYITETGAVMSESVGESEYITHYERLLETELNDDGDDEDGGYC